MKQKDQDYFVSGIIHIRVRASDAKRARERALDRQNNLNKSASVIVSLDNISTVDGASVDLNDAATLDVVPQIRDLQADLRAALDDHQPVSGAITALMTALDMAMKPLDETA